MFKLMLHNADTNQSKIVECNTIEESRIAYTKALTETFLSIKGGIVYNCHWQTWKMYRENEHFPVTGRFSPREDTIQILSYDEFIQVVSNDGYGLWYNDGSSKDLISFGRTGDKIFVAHLSQNFNQYVPWDMAYQMYLDFLKDVKKCIVS